MNYGINDLEGATYVIEDIDSLISESTLEDIIDFYKVTKSYYHVHETFKSLAVKGFVYEPREPYPFEAVSNSIDIFKAYICVKIGVDGFKMIDDKINASLDKTEFIQSIGTNILRGHNYKPSIQTLMAQHKNPNFLDDY